MAGGLIFFPDAGRRGFDKNRLNVGRAAVT